MIADLWQRWQTAREDRQFAMALAARYGKTPFVMGCIKDRPELQQVAPADWQKRACVAVEPRWPCSPGRPKMLFRANLGEAEDLLADAEEKLWAEIERLGITWLEARDLATA